MKNLEDALLDSFFVRVDQGEEMSDEPSTVEMTVRVPKEMYQRIRRYIEEERFADESELIVQTLGEWFDCEEDFYERASQDV